MYDTRWLFIYSNVMVEEHDETDGQRRGFRRCPGDDLNIKLGAAGSLGALPDLAHISTEWLPIYAAQDVVLPLNDTFAEIGQKKGDTHAISTAF